MSDEFYLEEQRNEIEILQSIYPTELQILTEEPPARFAIRVDINDEDEIRPCALSLSVEYTAKYPEELPYFSIELAEEEDGAREPPSEIEAVLEPVDIEHLTDKLRETGQESLGMAMVFTMATVLKELTVERLSSKTETLKRRKEARLQKEIEADQAKFIGTPVTRESFLGWKAKFDVEMKQRHLDNLAAQAASSIGGGKKAASAGSKKDSSANLTGRELFEQDTSMALSDSKFVTEGDVSVDASLFAKEDIETD